MSKDGLARAIGLEDQTATKYVSNNTIYKVLIKSVNYQI
jgi:hypothetical protein